MLKLSNTLFWFLSVILDAVSKIAFFSCHSISLLVFLIKKKKGGGCNFANDMNYMINITKNNIEMCTKQMKK